MNNNLRLSTYLSGVNTNEPDGADWDETVTTLLHTVLHATTSAQYCALEFEESSSIQTALQALQARFEESLEDL